MQNEEYGARWSRKGNRQRDGLLLGPGGGGAFQGGYLHCMHHLDVIIPEEARALPPVEWPMGQGS